MIIIILIFLSCIPREDRPERSFYLSELHTLPSVLDENSGLMDLNKVIWYINDSDNEPEIIGYDRERNVVTRTVVVKGVSNIDWEDITQNEGYIFIGDFGNNKGNRTDLKIIRIRKADLEVANDTVIPSGIISFVYEDQNDFTSSPAETPFDCEAFIATGDELILFTKDWITNKTRLYKIPATPGNYSAKFAGQWDVDGLITSAAWSVESKELILLGYTPVIPFIWRYSGFDPVNIRYNSARRIDFEDNIGTQTEGIMISDGNVYISSESSVWTGISQLPAKLFVLRER